jgi:hypothetical protein
MRSVILGGDTDEPLEVGVVGPDYVLVPNRFMSETAERVIERSGMAFQPVGEQQIWDGKRFRQRFFAVEDALQRQVKVLPYEDGYRTESNGTHDFINGGKGETIGLALDAWNSYDGSTKFGFAFNLLVQKCMNGLIVSHMLGGFRFKHTPSDSDDFDAEVDQAVEKLIALSESDTLDLIMRNFNQMAETYPDHRQMTALMKRSGLGVQQIGAVHSKIIETGQAKLSTWDWYQGMTNLLTHDAKGVNGENLGRCVLDNMFEMLN